MAVRLHCGCGVWKVPRWTVLFGMAVKKGAGACLLDWLYQVQLSNPISAAHCCREVVCNLICSCDTGCISICFTAALNVKRLQSGYTEIKSVCYLSVQKPHICTQYLHILVAQWQIALRLLKSVKWSCMAGPLICSFLLSVIQWIIEDLFGLPPHSTSHEILILTCWPVETIWSLHCLFCLAENATDNNYKMVAFLLCGVISCFHVILVFLW